MKPVHFLKAAFGDYKVGAFTASSRYTVRRIVGALPTRRTYVVEYGAGDGVITEAILKKLPADGRVVAVELNGNLLKELHGIRDERLSVVTKDVREVVRDFSILGLPRADAVVSGIPFSFFSPRVREEIVRRTHAALAPHGRFIVYQYSFLMLPLLKKYFRVVRMEFEPRNFLPYFIMIAEK